MTKEFYFSISIVVTILVLFGIFLMNKVKTARIGNIISAFAILIAIITSVIYFKIIEERQLIYLVIVTVIIGSIIGICIALRIKMIRMPELVALLNGLGGAASAIVGAFSIIQNDDRFVLITSMLALIIGIITFVGSMIAGGKLAKIISARPIIWKSQRIILNMFMVLLTLWVIFCSIITVLPIIIISVIVILSGLFAFIFTIRVGGADMPITISLLNSLSGVAGAIAGIALGDIMLITIGAIVGSSGLVLTEIMSKAINRPLFDILSGKSVIKMNHHYEYLSKVNTENKEDPLIWLKQAKKIIIVPGYGMAVAQAQYLVKTLFDKLEKNHCEVKFAIHPVAGRMPGHMNVLLAEVGIDYDKLYEMDDINDEFASCDVTIIIGANDVLNPAARDAIGTPIYGMPILNVDYAPKIIIFNYDTKPGYSGVENPIYHRKEGIAFMLGDAKVTLESIITKL